MPAHIVAPALGATDVPVTFSRPVLEGVLRGELGFKGVIVSDSLDMGAVAKSTDVAEAAVLSFLAGCDFLLTGKTDYRRTYDHFLAAVRSGRVPRERLDAAVARILALKARFPAVPPAADAARGPAAAKKVAEAALTAVRGGESLPLKFSGGPLVLVAFRSKSYAKELDAIAAALAARFPGAQAVFLDPKPAPADAAAARSAAAKAGRWWSAPTSGAARRLGAGRPGLEPACPVLSAQLSLMNSYDADDYRPRGPSCPLRPHPRHAGRAAAGWPARLPPAASRRVFGGLATRRPPRSFLSFETGFAMLSRRKTPKR
jgi:beta-N-acetylhexosaminidase